MGVFRLCIQSSRNRRMRPLFNVQNNQYVSRNHQKEEPSIHFFQNVRRVVYNYVCLIDVNLRIFKSCKSLNPSSIRFLCSHNALMERTDVNIEQVAEIISDSVEVIELYCRPDEIKWIFETANFCTEKRFETLFLSSDFVKHLPAFKDCRKKMLILSRCFRNIVVPISPKLSYNVVDFFMKYDCLVVFLGETNIEYNVEIVLTRDTLSGYRLKEDEVVYNNFNNQLKLQMFRTFKLFVIKVGENRHLCINLYFRIY
uniref:F-box domain-containing protein n=1 Tax=Strongyloides venezuelensis TaxID=75913 RepID=A0A0K0FM45_STRVS